MRESQRRPSSDPDDEGMEDEDENLLEAQLQCEFGGLNLDKEAESLEAEPGVVGVGTVELLSAAVASDSGVEYHPSGREKRKARAPARYRF